MKQRFHQILTLLIAFYLVSSGSLASSVQPTSNNQLPIYGGVLPPGQQLSKPAGQQQEPKGTSKPLSTSRRRTSSAVLREVSVGDYYAEDEDDPEDSSMAVQDSSAQPVMIPTSPYKVIDLTRIIVSGYNGARLDYDDFASGVVDRLTVNLTTTSHALVPLNARTLTSTACGLPTAVIFASDTLEMQDIREFEVATEAQLPAGGAVVIIFVATVDAPLSIGAAAASSALLNDGDGSPASPPSRSKDVLSKEVARYLATERNVSLVATNAHYLDYAGKHTNVLERQLLAAGVVLVRNLATPNAAISRFLMDKRVANSLVAFSIIQHQPSQSGSTARARSNQARSEANYLRVAESGATIQSNGRSSSVKPAMSLAGVVLASPRIPMACLSLSKLSAPPLDTRILRPIQTGFATEVEVTMMLKPPGNTYMATSGSSNDERFTASVNDDWKFGTCAKMPIVVARGQSSVVTVANLLTWESERRRVITAQREARRRAAGEPYMAPENDEYVRTWTIAEDRMILFQIVPATTTPASPTEDLTAASSTKLFIDPEVFVWLREKRKVHAFAFDHRLNSILGNRHEVESTLTQLKDTISVHNVYNLGNIRSSRSNGSASTAATASSVGSPTLLLNQTSTTGCNQFQCAFISLRLWPARFAPVQLFAISTAPGAIAASASSRPYQSPFGKVNLGAGEFLGRTSSAAKTSLVSLQLIFLTASLYLL